MSSDDNNNNNDDPKSWDLTTTVRLFFSFEFHLLPKPSFFILSLSLSLFFFFFFFFFSRTLTVSFSLSLCVCETFLSFDLSARVLYLDWSIPGPSFIVPDDWIRRDEKSLRRQGGFASKAGAALEDAHGRFGRGFVQANQQRVRYSGRYETKENGGYFVFAEFER
jgi:hypothetical protein